MTLREKMSFLLEDVETPIGKAITLLLIGLVLLSSGIFVAETYPLSPQIRDILDGLDTAILVLFSVEYLLRVWCASPPLRYVFSFFGLIDLVTILPLLLGAFDIRFIRIFRSFRILRLIRAFEGKTVLGYVTRKDSAIFIRILFTLFAIIFVYSGLIYQVEHTVNAGKYSTFLDAVYFSISTLSTAGFGDIVPITEAGRLLTSLMILTGLILIPWQLGDLIKQLVKTSNRMGIECTNCGLAEHDADAHFCKNCGKPLPIVELSDRQTKSEKEIG
jgi:voltage-gated potassium channel